MDGKFWRENRKENFFEVCLVRWGGRKINGGIQVFSPRAHQKVFSPKWRENWSEKLGIIFRGKCPCTIAHGLHPCCFSSHFFSSLTFLFFLLYVACLLLFLFFFFFPPPRCCLPLLLSFFFSFFFSFNLLGRLVQFYFIFLLSFMFFFFRCDFFHGHDFYFLINLGDWLFFFFYCSSHVHAYH